MRQATILALLPLLALALCTSPAPAQPAASTPQAAKPVRTGESYPLTTCPISGEKLGSMGDPVVKVYDGREVRFCCSGCIKTFEKDLAVSWAKVDEAIVKDQTPIYPLKTSVVSGKTLPDRPVDVVYFNRLVRLAEPGEREEFLKDPALHLAKLDKAVIDQQGKDYPLKSCPASGEALGGMGEPADVIVAGRLFRVCCRSCKGDIEADLAKHVAALAAARASSEPGKPGRK